MPIGMVEWPKTTLTATPAANDQETVRGAATDARPALVGKRYIARTESTKAIAIALIWMRELAPNGKIPAVKKNRAAAPNNTR
jgi:ribosomal protein S14